MKWREQLQHWRGRLVRRARLPGRLTARRALRQMAAAVEQSRAALADFDRCSTAEFSALANQVLGLDRRLGEVAAQAGELDALLQTQDSDHAHHSAFELYKKSVDLAHSCIGIALSQEEEMAQLESNLLQNQTQFAQNNLMFRVLVLNVRAESARTEIDVAHRTVFASVADEMDAMGRKMSATVDGAFTELEAIVREAASDRTHLQELENNLRTDAEQSISLLRTELERIRLSLEPCVAANREISRLLEAARSSTAALITALQYQDIVRQQQEHVSAGFDDLLAHTRDDARIDFAYLHQTARVQETNLQSSQQALEQAGGEISAAGTLLLQSGRALVSHYRTMEHAAAGVRCDSRLGALFKGETAKLIKIADLSEATNERIARLLDRIDESVRLFSVEISRHEFDVQLVALNAQVAAARVPEARALNKLTEEIARLSAHTAQLTSEMSAQLGGTLARLQGMRDEAGQVRETIGREKAGLTEGVNQVDEKLAELNRRLAKVSTGATAGFRESYETMQELLGGLRFPQLVTAAYRPAESLCARLLDATAQFAGTALSAEGEARLAGQRRRYTMAEERRAHAVAVGAPPAVAAGSDPANAVELFVDPAPTAVTAEVAGTAAPGAPVDDGVELF